ncbi:MAG: ABC transporter substrate-binding protein [Xanthomonadales bacterium]|nr:ABC transporter substrate-binding protein [Xanthomonadales bacterium]
MNPVRWIPALLVLLVACDDAAPPDARTEIVYRHAMDGAPGSLDPAHSSSIYSSFVVLNLYDTLYRYRYLARPYQLMPNLAADMPEVSEDGLQYTIRLRDDAWFMDDPAFPGGRGRAVTAHDVVYSLQRHFDPATRSRGAWLWQDRITGLDQWKTDGSDYSAPVSGLQAVDDRTLRIVLTQPFPQLVHTLAHGYAAVVPREAVEHYGAEFANHPVGSGPFVLQSIDSARAILGPNPGFRRIPFSLEDEGFDPATQAGLGLESLQGRAPPFVDRIQVEFIAEDASRWSAYLSGGIDFLKVPVSQFDQVLSSRQPARLRPRFDNHHFESSLESGFVYTNFNLDDPRIGYHEDPERAQRNHALRCAIRKGFDWKARNRTFYSDLGEVFPGVIPPVTPEFNPDLSRDSVRYEPEAARQLLADHGWTAENLPVLEYGFPSSVTERQMYEQFRSFMVQIGWPADKVRPRIFATYGDYLRAYSNREVMLITSSWTMDYPDAENTIQLYYGPNASPGSNSANYRNPEFDALYRRSASLPPSAKRTELFRKMNEMVISDCATISGLSRRLLLMWRPETVMLPDRSFVGGYFLRFVDKSRTGQ